MLRARLQRPLAGIALLAMLALTLLPAIGRVQGSGALATDSVAAVSAPGLGAMCTARGLAYNAQAAVIEAVGFAFEATTPLPEPSGHQDSDCDYCALSAQAVSPAFFALSSLHPPAYLAGEEHGSVACSGNYPCGLGARGPPV